MHWIDGQDEPHFCHTSCDLLDAGPITDWLTEVKDWVEEHPFDVITILLGNGGYGDVAYAPAEMYVPWIESTGILQFPWLLDEFTQMWETPFNPVDREFPCTVQRPPDMEDDKARDRLYLLNHNLNLNYPLFGSDVLVPAVVLLNETNAVEGYGSLGVSTQGCVEDWGRAPNVLNVDFYDVGDGSVFEVAAQFNNVTYNRECCGRAPNGSARPTIPLRVEVVLLVALLIMIHG
ncbi:putative secreted protein like [Verticillium longisporum]|nr:putative secreted protein like [Verticillium longisporum]